MRIDNQTELLGIPGNDAGTGEAQVELMKPLLEQYNLMDKIKFMCLIQLHQIQDNILVPVPELLG